MPIDSDEQFLESERFAHELPGVNL
jgi:hypothetical protein